MLGRAGVGFSVIEEIPVEIDVALVDAAPPCEAVRIERVQEHDERAARYRRGTFAEPMQPRELDRGSEEPLDPMQPRRHDDRTARVPGADQRHVHGQLAAVRPCSSQQVVLK